MTDLSGLVLPGWAVPTRPRQAAVEGHIVRIREQWWREAITSRGLPGAPPVGATLTRAQVWSPAGDVFTLLWRTLAWGSGGQLRLNTRRLNSIAADVPRAEKLLTTAAETSRHDPAGAYAVLRPGARNAIPSLGSSFLTKFLYFAGGGAPDHPCLILDRVVATALHDQSIQAACSQRPNQRWRFIDHGNNVFEIRPAHTNGKCLDVAHNSTAHAADVIQATCSQQPNQALIPQVHRDVGRDEVL